MDLLIKHVVDITGNRDHAMLDISVASAVQELANAIRTRVLSISTIKERVYLRARVSIDTGGKAVARDGHTATADDHFEACAELIACLSQRTASCLSGGPESTFVLWVPIWLNDKADTCLEIVHAAPFSLETAHVIAGITGVYRNFRALLDYSERDSLTGLLNRKTFEDQLARMLQYRAEAPLLAHRPERRCKQKEEKSWLAVVDVDHFKIVNDSFGHLYGDEVLILIANQLQAAFRTTDRVFRFGGEEFVILLRWTTLEHARRTIDRFRSKIEAHSFPQVGRVTVSIGFVGVDPSEAPVIALGHADQALYFAKTHGRNQTCYYDELVEQGLLQTTLGNDTAEFF